MALTVEVVSRERVVWTGEASYVRVRTVEGRSGYLTRAYSHVRAAGGGRRNAAAPGGWAGFENPPASGVYDRLE